MKFTTRKRCLKTSVLIENTHEKVWYIIADSVTRHLESLAETSKKNMEWHGWKGAGESEWNLAAKVRPEEKVVLARIMPKNEARVVNVVDGKFIVDGCETVTHWMNIPKI